MWKAAGTAIGSSNREIQIRKDKAPRFTVNYRVVMEQLKKNDKSDVNDKKKGIYLGSRK